VVLCGEQGEVHLYFLVFNCRFVGKQKETWHKHKVMETFMLFLSRRRRSASFFCGNTGKQHLSKIPLFWREGIVIPFIWNVISKLCVHHL
jgi:hypothetical protein